MNLKKTALYDTHLALNAKMTPFGGFEMPVHYTGVKKEHLAVREALGVFDVSHMGEFHVFGPKALELQYVSIMFVVMTLGCLKMLLAIQKPKALKLCKP